MSRRYASGRFFGLVIVFVIAFGALIARLAWVQVVRAPHWRARAEVASTQLVEAPATRGRILDARGGVLAASETRVAVGVSRPAEWRTHGDLDTLARILGVSRRTVERAVARDERHVVIGEFRLEEDQREALRALGSITFDPRVRRIQPHGGMAKALLGRVNLSGDGLTGLESAFEPFLAGRPGRVMEIRDARDNVRERRVVEAPLDGADIVSTIDPHVQALFERELEAARVDAEAHLAQGIVMDPRTGDVIAMAQTPSLPDAADEGEEVSPWRVVPVTDPIEPGSVFKIFSAAALLGHGVCDTSTVFDGMREHKDQRRAKKRFEDGGYTIRDVHAVGRVSLRHAFARSSNIVFATATHELLSARELYEDLRSFGFGQPVGIGFPGETSGILRSPQDPLWSRRTQSTLAIGQEISVTSAHLAAAASAVLTDGTLHRPRLVRAIHRADGSVEELPPVVVRRGVVGPEVAAALRAMCVDVVSTPYGTGRRAAVEGLEVAGKTGTAQVAARTGGYLPDLYNPTFVGFAPATDPRLVVVVVLHRATKRDVSGGGAAAPCFAAVMREIAASTTLLDESVSQAVVPVEPLRAPKLVGKTIEEIRALAVRATWGSALPELPATGSVVGQIPPPGTPMRPGAMVQLAFAKDVR